MMFRGGIIIILILLFTISYGLVLAQSFLGGGSTQAWSGPPSGSSASGGGKTSSELRQEALEKNAALLANNDVGNIPIPNDEFFLQEENNAFILESLKTFWDNELKRINREWKRGRDAVRAITNSPTAYITTATVSAVEAHFDFMIGEIHISTARLDYNTSKSGASKAENLKSESEHLTNAAGNSGALRQSENFFKGLKIQLESNAVMGTGAKLTEEGEAVKSEIEKIIKNIDRYLNALLKIENVIRAKIAALKRQLATISTSAIKKDDRVGSIDTGSDKKFAYSDWKKMNVTLGRPGVRDMRIVLSGNLPVVLAPEPFVVERSGGGEVILYARNPGLGRYAIKALVTGDQPSLDIVARVEATYLGQPIAKTFSLSTTRLSPSSDGGVIARPIQKGGTFGGLPIGGRIGPGEGIQPGEGPAPRTTRTSGTTPPPKPPTPPPAPSGPESGYSFPGTGYKLVVDTISDIVGGIKRIFGR